MKKVSRKKFSDQSGFLLPTENVEHYSDMGEFAVALKEQKESTVMIPDADIPINRISIDGRVEGTDYRLSKTAFGDVCNFAKIPVGFLKQLAKEDEAIALDVLESRLASTFRKHGGKSFVLDTRTKEIQGVVSNRYSLVHNADVMDYALSASGDLALSNGWVQGAVARMTVINPTREVEPKKGDIVRVGSTITSSVNGSTSVRVSPYCERLVCTNGMVNRQSGAERIVRHVGDDVSYDVQEAIGQAYQDSDGFNELMQRSTTDMVDTVERFRSISDYLSHGGNGGGNKFRNQVFQLAQAEARSIGLSTGEFTLWNIVNGVTESAHTAKSLTRRTEIEQVGFDLLTKYSRN